MNRLQGRTVIGSERIFAVLTSLLLAAFLTPAAWGENPAGRVYRNGVVFTADSQNGIAEAVAIRDGRIVYVGSNQGVEPFIGAASTVIDLKGKFLMPGLEDGHMHPLEAGGELLKCSLNYESLTIAEMQQRIQACLDRERAKGPDEWLEVVGWFQESMLPAGVKTSRATLDALKTRRPIFVMSSFGHTALLNTHGLALAKITASTPDPIGGKIWRDTNGEPRIGTGRPQPLGGGDSNFGPSSALARAGLLRGAGGGRIFPRSGCERTSGSRFRDTPGYGATRDWPRSRRATQPKRIHSLGISPVAQGFRTRGKFSTRLDHRVLHGSGGRRRFQRADL